MSATLTFPAAPAPAAPARRAEASVRTIDATRRVLDAAVEGHRTPALQYAVVSAHDLLFAHEAGVADVAQARPVSPTTPFMAYSMTKPVTAMAVLQLVESGALSLDAPVSSWLPWQPYGAAVTVRQLLTHTGGVPSPLPLRWVHPASDVLFDAHAALMRVLEKQARRASRPGSHFRYSNIGYWLLGSLVEAVSGVPFHDYVTKVLLSPLPLERDPLGFGEHLGAPIASGYLERHSLLHLASRWLVDDALIGASTGPWVHIRAHRVNGAAFGGMIGSARGFAALLQDTLYAIAHGESATVGPRMREWLTTPQRLADGHTLSMTCGWHVRWTLGAHGAERVLYKEGGGADFHCLMRLYPQRGVGSVLMTNATSVDVNRLLDAADATFA